LGAHLKPTAKCTIFLKLGMATCTRVLKFEE
jgi:hypothetical protein